MATAKEDLARLTRLSSTGLVDIESAAKAWSVSRRAAAMRLARLSKQGWLTRIRRGIYYALPLESGSGEETTIADPWLMAYKLFQPCYIGGWTAAEHWGLTEQLFRSTFVATAANIRAHRQVVFGAEFRLARVSPERVQGVGAVWRGSERIPVSSPERTILDAMRAPKWMGGVRHLAEVFLRFGEASAQNQQKLLYELTRSRSGAAAKRLGFLGETLLGASSILVNGSMGMRSKGVIKLDPAVRDRGHLNSRWGLWVNVTLCPSGTNA